MGKIMEILAKETKGKSYNSMKYSYDTLGNPAFAYDETDKVIQWKDKGETYAHKTYVPLKELADKIKDKEPLIKYFLDGSRHVYKVDDFAYGKRVYPVIAGQVGVGCCKRVQGRMSKECFEMHYVISLPKVANPEEWEDDTYFATRLIKLNESNELKKYNVKFSAILPYDTSKAVDVESKYEDRGIAAIQNFMVEQEKILVSELTKKRMLTQDSYLLKDGSLEYRLMKTGREDLRSLEKMQKNYNWVIGVSKQFNPESIMDISGKPNGDYIAKLPLFSRTPVARYENKSHLGDVAFGVWYIRIREKKYTHTPFDGVIKVEKLMMPREMKLGIDSDTIDLISANLINERNPTCYGSDNRWANHLYPVFLTESYVKSQYLSTEVFLHLF